MTACRRYSRFVPILAYVVLVAVLVFYTVNFASEVDLAAGAAPGEAGVATAPEKRAAAVGSLVAVTWSEIESESSQPTPPLTDEELLAGEASWIARDVGTPFVCRLPRGSGKSRAIPPRGPAAAAVAGSITPFWSDKQTGASGRSYHSSATNSTLLCEFTRLCFNATEGRGVFLVPVADPVERARLQKQFADPKRMYEADACPSCKCFFDPAMDVVRAVAPEDVPAASFHEIAGHTLVFNQVFNWHQYFHMLLFFSEDATLLWDVEQHDLRRVDRVAFVKMFPPLSSMEAFLYSMLDAAAVPSTLAPPLWVYQHGFAAQKGVCFESAVLPPRHKHPKTLGNTPEESQAARNQIHRAAGWTEEWTCPPARTMVFYRSGDDVDRKRMILNQAELVHRLRTLHGLVDVVEATASSANTTEEQACLFATSGLVLTSHGAHMMNMVFCPPSAALIELAPTHINPNLEVNARHLGLYYDVAYGGFVPGVHVDAAAESVNNMYQDCADNWKEEKVSASETLGDHCPRIGEVTDNRKNGFLEYRNKVYHADYFADMAKVDRAVRRSVAALHRRCGGHWPGQALAQS